MMDNAEYRFLFWALSDGLRGAWEDRANELTRDGWLIDHVAMNGSFLLLVFWRPVATPPRKDRDDVPVGGYAWPEDNITHEEWLKQANTLPRKDRDDAPTTC